MLQKLKDVERERINKLEELETKANMQLERQLVMASDWSRALLTMRGKLKGTEWDPENSHKIDFSDFWRLLNSNNVQFVEYSNYGQTMSGCKFFLKCIYHSLHLGSILFSGFKTCGLSNSNFKTINKNAIFKSLGKHLIKLWFYLQNHDLAFKILRF
jgi:hypothetical protein